MKVGSGLAVIDTCAMWLHVLESPRMLMGLKTARNGTAAWVRCSR